MQPGTQCRPRKAQNVGRALIRFQCAKNPFVVDKGERYTRLKIRHHSQSAVQAELPSRHAPATFRREVRGKSRAGGGGVGGRACTPFTQGRVAGSASSRRDGVRGVQGGEDGPQGRAGEHARSGLGSCMEQALPSPPLATLPGPRARRLGRGGVGHLSTWLMHSAARSGDTRLAFSLCPARLPVAQAPHGTAHPHSHLILCSFPGPGSLVPAETARCPRTLRSLPPDSGAQTEYQTQPDHHPSGAPMCVHAPSSRREF